MKIELQPHVGKNTVTGRSQDLDQDRIFVDGQAVGIVHHRPGAAVIMTEILGEAIEQAVAEHVKQARGGVAPCKVVRPPKRRQAEPLAAALAEEEA